jgi:hypothetical protein
MHEVVELVKALAWPCVAFYFLVRFGSEIRLLLIEVPSLFRRVRTARALGVKFELDRLELDLKLAEKDAHHVRLKPPKEPLPSKTRED